MDAHWTPDQLTRSDLYPTDNVLQAIEDAAAIPLHETSGNGLNEAEDYHAGAPATGAQEAAYRAAADLYKKSFWEESVAAFDRIALDKSSPYRAAASYSAARATLNMGDYAAVPLRIHAIVSDPDMGEFHLAALHLIGTRADQLYNPQLIAAHYAETAYLLKAPASLICHDATALAAYAGASRESGPGFKSDLETYLRDAFPRHDDFFDYAERRQALDALAAHDPYFELLKAIAAPTPFVEGNNWLVDYSTPKPGVSGDRKNQQMTCCTISRRSGQ